MTTKQLIQQQVFTVAYRKYEKALKGHAYFKTLDSAMSQDLVQNTFMKTWNYINNGGKVHNMKAFLYRVLNHSIVDEYRKHKTESLDKLIEKKQFEEPNGKYPERICDIFDGRSIYGLVEKLPEKFQQVVHMRYIKNLSLDEISSITKQSKNTIAVQSHRGRKELQRLYDRVY